jgi:hypothetical protein
MLTADKYLQSLPWERIMSTPITDLMEDYHMAKLKEILTSDDGMRVEDWKVGDHLRIRGKQTPFLAGHRVKLIEIEGDQNSKEFRSICVESCDRPTSKGWITKGDAELITD